MKWKSYFIGTLILILPVTCTIKDQMLLSNYNKISLGMSEKEVIDLLGQPKIKNSKCEWTFVIKVEKCDEIYVYSTAWAPLIPEYPVIWFDKNKNVLEKYIYHSP